MTRHPETPNMTSYIFLCTLLVGGRCAFAAPRLSGSHKFPWCHQNEFFLEVFLTPAPPLRSTPSDLAHAPPTPPVPPTPPTPEGLESSESPPWLDSPRGGRPGGGPGSGVPASGAGAGARGQ